jgi:Winged helix DNA-binding domain
VRTLTWDQVRGRRLARNHLRRPAPRARLLAVVGEVCGVQAQVLGAAELAIGARVDGLGRQDVQAELWQRRGLVKTYGPRGTLHLLPAAELPMWMAALRAIPNHQGAMWYELAGVGQDRVEELVEATGQALDGRRLSRDELAAEVAGRVGGWARDRLASTWGDLLAPAALTGALCFGPSRGVKVTFVRADQWIGGWRREDPRAALLEVLRRYLRAYGPSTPQEFARWFATRPATARELLAELGGEVAEVEVEGQRAWLLAADLEEPFEPAAGVVRLLPQYDCFVIGSRPREQLLPDAVQARVRGYRRGRWEGAVALSTLLVDGLVAGIWERRAGRGRVALTVATRPLTARQRRLLEAEAARVGAFLGAEPALTVGALP